jgi:hypothetical protein
VAIRDPAVPTDWRNQVNFMEWKFSHRQARAEQDKTAFACTSRTGHDAVLGKLGERLPEFAALGTAQGDIDASRQYAFRSGWRTFHGTRAIRRPGVVFEPG